MRSQIKKLILKSIHWSNSFMKLIIHHQIATLIKWINKFQILEENSYLRIKSTNLTNITCTQSLNKIRVETIYFIKECKMIILQSMILNMFHHLSSKIYKIKVLSSITASQTKTKATLAILKISIIRGFLMIENIKSWQYFMNTQLILGVWLIWRMHYLILKSSEKIISCH